jgi:alkylation response protein AidB-like acyl-CoA dehydrogenase
LTAEVTDDGFVLNGFVPWVTGAQHAQSIVIGATILRGGEPTADQILIALLTDLPGLMFPPPEQLVALSASRTGEVHFDRVRVPNECLLAGPSENVMTSGIGGRAGGHETSALAIGLSAAAIGYLREEAAKRNDLVAATESLEAEHAELKGDLLAVARGEDVCTNESLRKRANSIVLRSTEAALTAAKGTGFMASHPVGRWCREALFFLVWSCPQPVANAHLCALAGISDD